MPLGHRAAEPRSFETCSYRRLCGSEDVCLDASCSIPSPAFGAGHACWLPSIRPRTSPQSASSRLGRRLPGPASARASETGGSRARIRVRLYTRRSLPRAKYRVHTWWPRPRQRWAWRPGQSKRGPHKAISKQRSDELSWSKLKHQLSAIFSPGIVVERAERGAVEVILNIAWIVVVEDVEHRPAGA